ncbi:MerR family transcriptional regulator [Faecalicoccus pleomorphus]|uniref:MerR family transcriptional regulator n=1 Tax=Faecalicoccus pleomorphus TaxID=1323 RepID=UPI0024317C14|nr:MerR family transcriptional regulator [Faecalicoccus pleomorphus]
MYSIGQVSKMFDLPIPTLRYYDKEGLFQDLEREPSGIRKFNEKSIEALRVIECLKKSGMQIKEIREFMNWCSQGDHTLEKRKEMFCARRQEIEKQMEELQRTLDMVKFKCWYYETACKEGTEVNMLQHMEEDMPADIVQCYENAHANKL